MSNSKTDKIRERLEKIDYGNLAKSELDIAERMQVIISEHHQFKNALEAVVEELSKQQAHSNRWSDEYREAQELLDRIADELDVEES